MDALVLDDDNACRQVLAGMLEVLGYRVFSVSTIEDAVAIVYLYELDVLVTDWWIGRQTPETLLTLVAKMSPSCRRVVLSGSPRGDSGYTGGAVSMWLVKPISIATLRDVLGVAA